MAVERIEPSAHEPLTRDPRLSFLYRSEDAASRSFAVDRYRRRVALLKRLLPAIGVALLLLVAEWPRLVALWRSSLEPPAIDLRQARHLTMVDARFAGLDRQNRPYVVTAAVARQLPEQRDLLALEKPRAELAARPGSSIVMTAGSGIYQSAAGLLDLFGKVDLLRPDGSRFETRRAHLNLSADTARGEDPVEGQGPQGRISSQGFRILNKGNTIFFTGKARAVLSSSDSEGRTAPRGLPAAIVRKAALLESAALARWHPRRAAKTHRSRTHLAHGRRPAATHSAHREYSRRMHSSPGKEPSNGH